MSFQDSFWGPHGFEELRKAVKEGQDFTKEIAAILHERADLEASYAKSLSKFSSKITKISKLALGTTQHTWQEVALEMESEAESHRQLSSGLDEDVAKPMKVLIEYQHKQRKFLEGTVDKSTKSLNDRRNEESKVKKLSYACAKDNERAQEQALDSKPNRGKILTEKDIHKLESKRRKAEESVARADIDYYNASLKAERARQDWESAVYRVSGAFRQLEEERLNSMQDFVQKYANHLTEMRPSLQQGCERLNLSIGTVDVNSDLQTMVETKGTGQNIPEQILPDFYAENLSNEMKKERRKENLEKFLRIVKHDMDLERKGKQGVENLARVFHETSTFADADAQQDVHDKLQHVCLQIQMRAMLAYYEGTRYKLHCALSEMEGRMKPSHPLSSNMEIRNKQGVFQTVLKVPHWVRLERRNSESSGSGSSDIPDFDTNHDQSNRSYPDIPVRVIPSRVQCQALYNYQANLADELTLHPGDIIRMVEKTSDGWWHGQLNGRSGVFPSTYVQELGT